MGGQANACNNTSTTGFDTTISICPAGWRLPTGTSSGDFYKLNQIVNSGSTTSPQGLIDNFLAVYSGSYSNGLYNQGTSGVFWSSTVNSATYAYYLFFGSTGVSPGTGNYNKSNGRSIRCIL